MRRALVVSALLVAAGCVAPWSQGDVPFILVEETYSFDPADAVIDGFLGVPCPTAEYALDPPRVALVHPPRQKEPFEPDVVVVIDRGDGWRANQANGSALSGVLAMAAGSRSTAVERVVDAFFGIGGTSTTFGMGAPFRDAGGAGQYAVHWSDGAAKLGDEPLRQRSPREVVSQYVVRDVHGDLVNVTQTVRATYAGLAVVEMVAPAAGC